VLVAILAGILSPTAGPGQTLGRSLLRVVIIVTAFGIILSLHRIWPIEGQVPLPRSRLAVILVLLAAMLLAVDFFLPEVLSVLSPHERAGEIVARLVDAGGGWLVPVLLLATFVTVMLIRRRRLR